MLDSKCWDKTNKELISFKTVISFVCLVPVRFLLSSINIRRFCATWMTSCKGPILASLSLRGSLDEMVVKVHCGTVLGDAYSTWRQIRPPKQLHNGLWQPSRPDLPPNLKVANWGYAALSSGSLQKQKTVNIWNLPGLVNSRIGDCVVTSYDRDQTHKQTIKQQIYCRCSLWFGFLPSQVGSIYPTIQ